MFGVLVDSTTFMIYLVFKIVWFFARQVFFNFEVIAGFIIGYMSTIFLLYLSGYMRDAVTAQRTMGIAFVGGIALALGFYFLIRYIYFKFPTIGSFIMFIFSLIGMSILLNIIYAYFFGNDYQSIWATPLFDNQIVNRCIHIVLLLILSYLTTTFKKIKLDEITYNSYRY
ncbi:MULTISPECIES: hypothetical protein [Aerococcus]|uniref:Uncharacterized protein n=1 Tax=Aerococcus tenax TaxID=3078812 RepID=A0A5N1BFU7_9LACT|nr:MULTISPECIES: hypothetical protein [Aerococcus]KAA9237651.1 hypothetical protein F6I34_09410 [Aerococcus urinae]MDK6371629.1 hypothetical protein [Aerococcus urinae]MDK6597404.1 hypothetical protein [Aerococcus urinae]MDK7802034.1 hypothetical protein [Aerococcus urinae]MDK8655621.1 hypothetical protein [Aerococcus urinae]